MCSDTWICAGWFPPETELSRFRLMTHIARIRGVFDVANSQRYRAGFAPMLFQWSHAHIARFFVAKNRAIKRGLERKNRAIKKSRYVCHGT